MRSTSLFLTVLAGAIFFGIASGVGEVAAQSYVSLELYRNAFLVLREWTLRWTGLGVVFAATVAIVHVFLARSGRFTRPIASAVAIVSALSIWGVRGYFENRYDLRLAWVTKSAHFGGRVPEALFDGAVWRANGAITLAALAIGLALYVLPLLITRTRRGTSLLHAGASWLRPVTWAAFFLLIVTTIVPAVLFRAKPSGPSVVWISLDTLRADFLSGYGYKDETSPALDSFGKQCAVFEKAYSQAPSTLPSHSSFLTSRYPTVNLVTEETKRLPPWRVLAMEIFREAGFRTAGIVDTPFLTAKYGLDQGYDDFVPRGNRALSIIPLAREWLAKYGSEPYFLFLHMYDIHSPYARDPKYKQMFLDFDYKGDIDPAGGHLGLFRRKLDRGAGLGYEIDADDARYLKTLYAGGLRRADDVLADFLTYLIQELPKSTLLIITSDHGEEFMEHGTVLHSELYRTITHVPLMIRLPGGEAAGTRIARSVGLIDLLPTVLDVCGLENPAPMSGRSLLPVIRGESASYRPYVFSEFEHKTVGRRLSVLDDRYHLVVDRKKGTHELYRHDDDPYEQRDLWNIETGVADSLLSLLEAWEAHVIAERGEESERDVEAPELDPETVRELKAFGYLD